MLGGGLIKIDQILYYFSIQQTENYKKKIRVRGTSLLVFTKMLMVGVDRGGIWVNGVLFFIMMSSFVIDMI